MITCENYFKIIKLKFLKLICKLLLPKNIWIGNHFGPFTQKYTIEFGTLDNRGVIQGLTIIEVIKKS
jgi:hypothetical protein